MREISQISFEKDVPCRLRDGLTLYANVYRPQQDGAFPVLLSRLPYNKNLPEFSHRYIDPFRLAEAGYVVIIQDVRGRFASEGEFEPFLHEANDGYDVVEWAAGLPYCNGEVGMFGLSYYGFTQLYAAAEHPPSLKTIFPAQAGSDLRDGLFYRGGAFEWGLFATWMLDSIALNLVERQKPKALPLAKQQIAADLNKVNEWLNYTPLNEWPPLTKHKPAGDLFKQYITQEISGDFFARTTIKQELKELDIPAYHLAGWYDCFLGPTLSNYQEMNKSSQQQKLIIGPWGHGDFSAVQGERFFGSAAAGDWIDQQTDITQLHIDWFDCWLKEGSHPVLADDAPVKLFTMGINEWRSENEWPLQRAEYVPFFLHSEGEANVHSGQLNTIVPGDEPADVYTYDPQHPVPTHGGSGLFYQGANAGPVDQRRVEARSDVLVYTSERMTEPLEVTGPVIVHLWAATDAADTDFTAKLVDVFPDGRAYNLTDGIIRAKHRNGYQQIAALEEEAVHYQIDLWATSNVFLPGHSIRIEIASSNFPRYDINPNTGKSTVDSDVMRQAKQTVYHQMEFPSHVVLPIIK